MISIKHINKSFQDGQHSKAILCNLNLSIRRGERVALTGESGSGKSTLLHLLAAIENPDSGSIFVGDKDLSTLTTSGADQYRREQLGIIFQNFNLIECLSVWDNICFPARLNGHVEKDYINRLIADLGLSSHLKKYPQNLSGGEQQRVAIARALAHKPDLILADEPTGNLDEKNSQKVAELLMRICETYHTTLLMVTHSHVLANQAQRHLHLRNGQINPAHVE